MPEQTKYWFPAKKYGWGWGAPSTWQGWSILILYVALISAGSVLAPPGKSLFAFIGIVIVLSGAFLWICWKTGEPPHWHWGDSED